MSDLTLILDIIAALLLGALLSWIVTYYVLKTKINRMRNERLYARLMEEAEHFNKGFAAGVDSQKAAITKTRENSYLAGYDDGVKNEQYVRDNKPKHNARTDDDTAVMPAFVPKKELLEIMPIDVVTAITPKIQS